MAPFEAGVSLRIETEGPAGRELVANDKREFPTPAGWTRNKQGFDEPPSASPSGKVVLLFLGGLVGVILVAILVFQVLLK